MVLSFHNHACSYAFSMIAQVSVPLKSYVLVARLDKPELFYCPPYQCPGKSVKMNQGGLSMEITHAENVK